MLEKPPVYNSSCLGLEAVQQKKRRMLMRVMKSKRGPSGTDRVTNCRRNGRVLMCVCVCVPQGEGE